MTDLAEMPRPQTKLRTLDEVIMLRRRIIEAMEGLHSYSSASRISAEMIQKWIEMKHGFTPSLSQLGNNLRILQVQGIVDKVRVRGYRYWSRTGRKYQEEFPVRILLPLPNAMYTRLTQLAKVAHISRVKFIRNIIAVGMSHLDPLKRAEDYVDYLEEWVNSKEVRSAFMSATTPLSAKEIQSTEE